MITPALVQAEVIDIRKPASPIPPEIVMDANVLYWIFYPNFPYLRAAGGSTPLYYQVTEYRGYWQRGTRAKTQFHAAVASLGEFAQTAEYAELETIWLTDPSTPQPDPTNPVTQFTPRVSKFARYHYSGQLAMVRTGVETMIAVIRASIRLLPQFPTPDDLQNRSLAEWRLSRGDFPDAAMVASAKYHSKPHILSDDMDIATFPGITLYTANQRTIAAASTAGKLR